MDLVFLFTNPPLLITITTMTWGSEFKMSRPLVSKAASFLTITRTQYSTENQNQNQSEGGLVIVNFQRAIGTFLEFIEKSLEYSERKSKFIRAVSRVSKERDLLWPRKTTIIDKALKMVFWLLMDWLKPTVVSRFQLLLWRCQREAPWGSPTRKYSKREFLMILISRIRLKDQGGSSNQTRNPNSPFECSKIKLLFETFIWIQERKATFWGSLFTSVSFFVSELWWSPLMKGFLSPIQPKQLSEALSNEIHLLSLC